MTEKYKIANMSMTPVGARALIPSSIIGPMVGPKPAASAKAVGTRIKATSAERRLVMIKAMKAVTSVKPRVLRLNIGPLMPTGGARATAGSPRFRLT